MSSWSELRLGEAIHIKHGFAFKGEFFAPDGDLMVLTPGNFLEKGGFRTRLGKERFYTGEFPENYLLAKDDLIIAMTEQGEGLLGSAARIPADDRYLHNQRLGLVTISDSRKICRRFLYWVFNSESVRAHIRATATGTKVRHTAPERIYKLRVSVPPVDEQSEIAAMLDKYDALIETNRCRIALLEESARLLYREWFVDFRFPSAGTISSESKLPIDWEETSLGQVVDAIGGATPSTNRPDFWDGDIVWLTPTDVTKNDCLFLPTSTRKITAAGYDSCSTTLLNAGTIFMSSRASIGYFALLDQPACTNQGFIAVVPKIANSRNFFLFHLMDRVEEFEQKATGSTFKELSKKAFRDMCISLPPAGLLADFEVKTQPFVEQIMTLKKVICELAQARDELLPKLMSGELRL